MVAVQAIEEAEQLAPFGQSGLKLFAPPLAASRQLFDNGLTLSERIAAGTQLVEL